MPSLIVLLAVIVSTVSQGSCERAFVFQGDNQLSNESRAVIYLTSATTAPTPLVRNKDDDVLDKDVSGNEGTTSSVREGNDPSVLSDLSVCLWLKVFYFRKTAAYVFSYATSNEDNNELNFGILHKRVLIAVGGKYIYGKNSLYIPDKWYHICFVADSNSRTGTLYVNGKTDVISRLTPRQIFLNGSLVLGQETDQVDGGYQSLQSFSGAVTAFNLYSRPLSSSEVKNLSKCSPAVDGGDVVDWAKADWDLFGPVTFEDIEEEEYCSPDNFNFIVFTKKRTLEKARNFCKNLKSTIALPRTEEENSILYAAAEPFTNECQPHNHATAFFWVGAYRAHDGNWTDELGSPLTYSNFKGKQFRGCAGFLIPPEREDWHTISCSSLYEFCSACQEREPVLLKMRGLCDSAVHDYYFRMVEQYGEMPYFKGFTKYNIIYDNNGTWELQDVWTNNVLAKFFTYSEELPFGRRQWLTTTNFDICLNPMNKYVELSMSACYDWEYSCSDGSCINLTQRCDLRVDCPDLSDEIGCEKLLKPPDYLGALPPTGAQPGSPLLVNISVNIQGFSEIDIVDMKLVVEFTLAMTWSDSRLQYKNLSPMSDLNYIKPDSVFIPRVELMNADFPKTHRTKAELHILKQSDPEDDNLSRVSRDEVYEGASNPLRLTQKFSAPFSCPMDMRNFPFDRQHCELLIRFSSAKKGFIEWDNLLAKYLGQKLLAEYLVEEITIKEEVEEEYSLAVVGITFSRRYSYFVTSAYLPTFMLMMIGYASLFCKKESKDLRVMMSLTALLVLYSNYQQISDDLPKTSYTKAIDIWCFFAITFIFSQVILHVAVDVKLSCPTFATCCCSIPNTNKMIVVEGPPKVSLTKVLSKDQADHNKEMETSFGPELVTSGKQNGIKTEPTVLFSHRCCRYNLLEISRVFYVVLFSAFCGIYWSMVLSSE